jgi:hypothetical protein
VDRAAQNMLAAKLMGSRFSDQQIIEDMVDAFERRVVISIYALRSFDLIVLIDQARIRWYSR